MSGVLEQSSVRRTIDAQYRRRAELETIGIKVNLYEPVDVEGLALVAGRLPPGIAVESFMVGDSYLMTHLGRGSTTLVGLEEQAWGLRTMVGLVAGVARAMHHHDLTPRPYLVADLPDCATDLDVTLGAAEQLVAAGADVVKVEVNDDPFGLVRLEHLVGRGLLTMAHIGYTPQRGSLRRHGDTVAAAAAVFAMARRVRDAGASALVLEMVSEAVNRALSRPTPQGLPVYSIFSGRCGPGGGQSINVWDAVYRHPSGGSAFPPTALCDPSQYSRVHSPNLVASCTRRLLDHIAGGCFPPTPRSGLARHDAERISAADPWTDDRSILGGRG